MTSKPTKTITQLDDAAAPTAAAAAAAARRGPVRRQRKVGEQEKQANGRTHEENQERAYIAASRRSDRSIEARLESARRASEIHKRRCGRGLKVTEEAVMNEEMYEEEDPDYEQRVSRLRMVMNTPNYPYAAFSPMQQFYPQNLVMPNQPTTPDGSTHNHPTPGTPGTATSMEQQHPQPQFLFSPWFSQSQNGLAPVPQSPMSPGATTLPGNFGPMSPPLPNYHASPGQTSQPSPHFLPPTQFPTRQETPRQVPKSANPAQITVPEAEVVFDSAPLDLFADVNLDASDEMWSYNDKSLTSPDWLT